MASAATSTGIPTPTLPLPAGRMDACRLLGIQPPALNAQRRPRQLLCWINRAVQLGTFMSLISFIPQEPSMRSGFATHFTDEKLKSRKGNHIPKQEQTSGRTWT